MSQIIPFGPGAGKLPQAFAGVDWKAANEAATGGISGGFPVLSIRGKVFRVKVRGEEKPILTREGDPVPSLSVIVLATNPGISKIFYKNGFDEGASAPPDCFSTNGDVPDAAVQHKQSDRCATCPQNVWGSKITPNGTKVQACANSKRLAIIPALRVDDMNPYDDAAAESVMRNEIYGGPMLFRMPGSALNDWSKFTQVCNSYNVPFFAVVARLRFDPSVAYPRPIFEGVRMLSEHEARVVEDLRHLPVISRIISETAEAAKDTTADAVPPAAALAPPPAPVQVALPPPAPVPVQAAPPPPPPPAPVQVAPPPPAPVEVEYTISPDGLHRWRPGMAAWEPVPPAPVAAPAAPPAPPAPPAAPAVDPAELETLRAKAATLSPPPTQEAAPAAPAPAAGVSATSAEMDNFLAETAKLAG